MSKVSTGHVYHYKDLTFFAENGLIRIINEKTGEYSSATRRDFLLRINAINKSLGHVKWSDEREQDMKFVEDGIKCCREAKNQGCPDDYKAIDDMLKERRKHILHANYFSKSNALPSSLAPENVLLPPLPCKGDGKIIT